MNTATLEFPPIAEPATEVVDAAPAATESALVLIRRNTLAELNTVDRGIAALKAAHGAIDYDINTPKGMQAAKDHRLAVRDARYKVPHIVKARKSELKEVSEALDSEAERITAALLAIEKPHDDAIKAREQVLADEKAERERKAAERAAKFAADIANIRAWLTRCQEPGMTAERISIGIEALSEFTFPAETWAEFAVPAANAQCETLESMRTLYAQTLAREEEAARIEAQRVENARVAAEQAEQRRQLAEQAAELARQQREAAESVARIARLQARIAEIHAAATGHDKANAWDLFEAIVAVENLNVSEDQYQELAPLAAAAQASTLAALNKLHTEAVAREDAAAEIQRVLAIPLALTIPPEPPLCGECVATTEYPEAQGIQQVLKAEPETADATDRDAPVIASVHVGAIGSGQAADAAPAEVPTKRVITVELDNTPAFVPEVLPDPTLTLGAINEAISPLRIDGAGLALLGFEPAATRKGAKLFHESDWPAMHAAMTKHLAGAA